MGIYARLNPPADYAGHLGCKRRATRAPAERRAGVRELTPARDTGSRHRGKSIYLT
jgi:hypothetical protein